MHQQTQAPASKSLQEGKCVYTHIHRNTCTINWAPIRRRYCHRRKTGVRRARGLREASLSAPPWVVVVQQGPVHPLHHLRGDRHVAGPVLVQRQWPVSRAGKLASSCFVSYRKVQQCPNLYSFPKAFPNQTGTQTRTCFRSRTGSGRGSRRGLVRVKQSPDEWKLHIQNSKQVTPLRYPTL